MMLRTQSGIAYTGRRADQVGFTLMELMIVVTVIGILAAIAYPSYTEYVRRSKRVDAQTELLEMAQFMERYYTENNSYVDAVLPVTESPKDAANKAYDIEFAAAPTASAYTLRAVPKNSMDGDGCGTLTLTSTGVKGAGGTVSECWRQ